MSFRNRGSFPNAHHQKCIFAPLNTCRTSARRCLLRLCGSVRALSETRVSQNGASLMLVYAHVIICRSISNFNKRNKYTMFTQNLLRKNFFGMKRGKWGRKWNDGVVADELQNRDPLENGLFGNKLHRCTAKELVEDPLHRALFMCSIWNCIFRTRNIYQDPFTNMDEVNRRLQWQYSTFDGDNSGHSAYRHWYSRW